MGLDKDPRGLLVVRDNGVHLWRFSIVNEPSVQNLAPSNISVD